jgi:hypothetical protein
MFAKAKFLRGEGGWAQVTAGTVSGQMSSGLAA